MNRSPLRALLLISFVLVCFTLSPTAQAVCREGCLNSDNTVLGDEALSSNVSGYDNTATGHTALLATYLASGTRPPVLVRSIITPKAA